MTNKKLRSAKFSVIKVILFSLVLSVLVLVPLYGDTGDIAITPMIKFSYDLNLGTTVGLGLAVIQMGEGIGQGPYFIYSYSKKMKGKNLSLGYLAGLGLASFKVGLNRMTINSESGSKVYWGIYTSPNFLLVHIQGGMMFEDADVKWEKRKLNLSGGLGFF